MFGHEAIHFNLVTQFNYSEKGLEFLTFDDIVDVFIFIYCWVASVVSEQQHKQDLRKIYRRGDEFSN